VTLALVIAIPLATSIAIALVGGRLGRRTLGIATTLGMAASFGAGLSMLATLRDRPSLEAFIAPWLPIPGADFTFVIDTSMLDVALAITGVSALIAMYSIGYLTSDRGAQRYFAAFALLVAGMLVVVLGANLLLIVAGWSVAGMAAYVLLAQHEDHPPAVRAALKAFLFERIGDAALLAGAMLLLSEFHTVDLAQLGGSAIEHGSASGGTAGVASALLLIGALAKSAQAPLHGWLLDSTEASTPVSALIQTVAVTGGVVLLMRLRSILVPDVLQAAAIVGGVTAAAAGLAAIAQRDVRRVIAWSTVSQVGSMFVAAGLGALFAARFQLIAHALLKAVLALGVGSVRRATGDRSDIAGYGGLGRRMPWTAGALALGTLALAGIPPAAGFFGITAVASAALSDGDLVLTVLVLLAGASAAFAGVRLFTLLFVAPRSAGEAHEAPPLQDIPLALLALAALVFGALVTAGMVPFGSGPADDAPLWLAATTFGTALIASTAAWLVYRHGLERAASAEHIMRWARDGLELDAVYRNAVARPFLSVARELDEGAESVNRRAIDALGSIAVRASNAIGRGHPAGARAQQALLLTGAVALLAFWTWSAR